MEAIFEMPAIHNAFLYITLVAACICIMLTIVAVAKSMSSMTFENKKPVTYVLKSTAKACLSFIMVPLLCLFMLSMSNIVVSQAQTAMTAHLGASKVPSTGEYIFLTSSIRAGKKYLTLDLLTDTSATLEKYKTRLVDNNLDAFGNIGEIAGALDELSYAVDHNLVEDDFRIGNVTSALDKIDVSKASQEVLQTKKEIEATIDSINKEINRVIESSYPYLEPSMEDELRMSYLNGEKNYLNVMHSGVDFSVFRIDYLLGFVSAGFIALIFLGLIIQFIRRMLELVVLYLTAPFFAAAIPLDEGQMFKKWRENFIAKFLAGFSVLFALKLYLLMLPLIFSSKLDLGTTIIGDTQNIGSAVIGGFQQGSDNAVRDFEESFGGSSIIGDSNGTQIVDSARAMDDVVKSATGYAEELGLGDNTLYETLLRSSGIKDRNSPTETAAFVNSVIKLLFLIGGTWAVYKSQTLVMDILHPDTSESTRQTTVLAFMAARKILSTGADVAKKGVQMGGTLAVTAATGGVGGAAAAGLKGAGIAKKGVTAAAKAAGSAAKTAAGTAKGAVSKGSDDS